jgi:hypothetical protein
VTLNTKKNTNSNAANIFYKWSTKILSELELKNTDRENQPIINCNAHTEHRYGKEVRVRKRMGEREKDLCIYTYIQRDRKKGTERE